MLSQRPIRYAPPGRDESSPIQAGMPLQRPARHRPPRRRDGDGPERDLAEPDEARRAEKFSEPRSWRSRDESGSIKLSMLL